MKNYINSKNEVIGKIEKKKEGELEKNLLNDHLIKFILDEDEKEIQNIIDKGFEVNKMHSSFGPKRGCYCDCKEKCICKCGCGYYVFFGDKKVIEYVEQGVACKYGDSI